MKPQGFIDLHTHGIGRYDTRTADPRDILKMADLYGRAGTAAFVPTIYPGPLEEMRTNMEAVRKAILSQQSAVGSRKGEVRNRESTVRGQATADRRPATILGVHLEGPFLNPVRAGALDRDFFLGPSLSSLKKLIEGYEDLVRFITLAPEMPGALNVIGRCASAGITVGMGHSDATYRQAEEGKSAGASCVTHLFNAMRPLHHREPGLAGFGLLDRDVYVEIIADGAHLHRKTLELILSAKRIDRIILVSDSVRGAKPGGSPRYSTGGILEGSGGVIADSVRLLRVMGVPADGIAKIGGRNPLRLLTKNNRSYKIGFPLTPP